MGIGACMEGYLRVLFICFSVLDHSGCCTMLPSACVFIDRWSCSQPLLLYLLHQPHDVPLPGRHPHAHGHTPWRDQVLHIQVGDNR